MKESDPSYFAIIPADVRYADIPMGAKMLYGEISCLCNKEGYCWASNKYFANLYGVSNRTISAWIKSLVDNKFIASKILKDKGNIRNISILLKKTSIGIEENFHTPIEKNFVYNNINNNNKNNNNPPTPLLEVPDFIDGDLWLEWIEYRKEKKKKLTPLQAKKQIKKLTDWHNEGIDVNQVIETSISNGWQGLFKPKEKERRTTNGSIGEQASTLLDDIRSGRYS